MDETPDGGVEGEVGTGAFELQQRVRLARGTLETPPLTLDDPWPTGALAWANTLDLDASSGAVFVIDDTGSILAINARVEALLGDTSTLIGAPIASVLASELDVPRAYEVPRGVRFVGPNAKVVAHRPDGTKVPVELEIVALDARTVLVVARSLASPTIDQIDIAEIVHDLKSPLSVISLEAQLAADRARAAQVPTVQLERIERNVAYMDRLVHDLLDLSIVDAGELALELHPVELCSLLESVIERTVASHERERVLLEARRMVIRCDDRRIERVIANLLDNALKHTPQHAGVLVRVTETSRSVCIAVIDAGPGIPHDEISRLFEKYRRGSTKRPGSGLGLFVSRKIVEAHGGRIGVESVRGIGSRFFVELPKEEARTPLVLIVDDDTDHTSPLAEILRMEGYDVATATSASDALAAIRGRKPDVMILDALLRHSRALDVLEALRRDDVHIPTAIVSGLPDSDPRIIAAVDGHHCLYVPKPIVVPTLLELLESLTRNESVKFPQR